MSSEPICAVCGRPIEGLPDAREADGVWFCSPGHLLTHESRPKRKRRSPLPAFAVLVAALAAIAGVVVWQTNPFASRHHLPAGFVAPVDASTRDRVFTWQHTAGCLFNHEVAVKTYVVVLKPGSKMHGWVAVTNVLGFGARDMDTADLYFFRTPQLARASAARSAAKTLYPTDLSSAQKKIDKAVDRLFGPTKLPTSAAGVERLVTVYGNTVAVWDYPRDSPRASERLLRRCFGQRRSA